MEYGPMFWIVMTACVVVACVGLAKCEEDCLKKRCAGGEKPSLVVTHTRTHCVCGAY